jgi:hypothetical protein
MQAHEPDQATVLDIARRVVAEAAPAEAPLFDAVVDAYLERPAAFLSDTGSSDDMLGFGGLEAVSLVTPLVLGQVQVLCAQATAAGTPNALVDLALKSVDHATGAVGGNLILWFLSRLLLSRGDVLKKVAVIPADKFAEIEQFVLDRMSGAINEAQAEQIATAILHAAGIRSDHHQ